MTAFEVVSIAIASVAAVVNLGALVFLGLQVRHGANTAAIASQARLDEWAQRRRESTLQFYMSTVDRRESYKTILPPDRDSGAIAQLIADAADDTTKDHAIRMYMNYFEMVATGVNSEVLDIEVIDSFAGSSVVAAWANYSPWIARQRQLFDAPTLSANFELMAKHVARRRNLPYREIEQTPTPPIPSV